MNEMNFKRGHFVKLKDTSDIPYGVNVFTIMGIEEDKVELDFNRKKIVSFNDIEPIPINGVDDRWIYARTCTLPDVYFPKSDGSYPKTINTYKTNHSYYLSAIKLNKKLSNQEFLKKHKLRYVHELQDYLYKNHNIFSLSINICKYEK